MPPIAPRREGSREAVAATAMATALPVCGTRALASMSADGSTSPNVLEKGRAWLKDTVGMKSGQIKSLEEPFLSLKKVVSEDDATKSGYKRLPQSERVQRAIEAACEHAEEKFGEKTPAWVLWIREHRAIVGGVWRCVFLVGKVYLWLYARLATAVRALPQQAMLMLFGITLAFFGGSYVATLAAVEAFRQIGGATLYKELLYVHNLLDDTLTLTLAPTPTPTLAPTLSLSLAQVRARPAASRGRGLARGRRRGQEQGERRVRAPYAQAMG